MMKTIAIILRRDCSVPLFLDNICARQYLAGGNTLLLRDEIAKACLSGAVEAGKSYLVLDASVDNTAMRICLPAAAAEFCTKADLAESFLSYLSALPASLSLSDSGIASYTISAGNGELSLALGFTALDRLEAIFGSASSSLFFAAHADESLVINLSARAGLAFALRGSVSQSLPLSGNGSGISIGTAASAVLTRLRKLSELDSRPLADIDPSALETLDFIELS